MYRPIRVALAATMISTAIPLVVAPLANAATSSFQGCSVQVNYPHSSHHNPGQMNTEFRVYNCVRATSANIDKWEYTSGGGGGGGDFAWKPVGGVTVMAGSSTGDSVFYNEPCTYGQTYTVDMKGRFTINSQSIVVEQSNTFVCD